MSATREIPHLTAAQFASILRDMARDERWRSSPVGGLVSRYIRWFRNEYGATEASVRDYEGVLAQMCLGLHDLDVAAVTVEDLRAVIDFWAKRSAGTRQKVTSVIRSFWSWAEDEGHVELSPARKIRRPKGEKKVARTLPLDARPRLLESARHPRDRLGLFCLCLLGLRRSELAGIQVRDFDADRGILRVYGKGQKERLMPLRGPVLAELRLYLTFDLPHMDRPPEGDDYLLHPIRRYTGGKGSEGQYIWQYVSEPKKRPSPQSVTGWWYHRTWDAGLVARGVQRGMNMHRARHTFLKELRRVAGLDAASQAAGHADLNTTLGIYGHQDDAELEEAMESYMEWVQGQEASRA